MLQSDDQYSGAEAELLSLILRYLNADELKTARVWNTIVNQIITNDPKLLWAKNVLRVQVDTSKLNIKLEWAKLRLLRLITQYNCPNFHIVKTNLLSSEALNFFQSSVRHQMKYLKITECQISNEILLHILACTARNLEYLEIHDFSKVVPSSGNLFPNERRGPYLFNLKTIILDNRTVHEDLESLPNDDANLAPTFLRKVLEKSVNLECIGLFEWNTINCLRYMKVLSSLPPGNLDNVQTLEMSCVLDDSLDCTNHYDFLNELQWVHLPNLKRLTVYCDTRLEFAPALSRSNIMEFTKSLAILIEGAAETLEVLELINCPVSNQVFRIGMNSFPNLSKVDTTGSLITKLDPNGNAGSNQKMIRRKKPRRIQIEGQVENVSRSGETDDKTPVVTRYEVYKILCGIIIAVILIYFGTTSIFGAHVATMLQVFIFSVIVFCFHESSEVAALWTACTQ
ncbi:unnamed protein product [Orchesella dallaii]|uniref:Uncharacterized protein n=1 Tax=Orchesella dallaii TaxID=48710 RepID=A0ABP1QGU2_9HEXA